MKEEATQQLLKNIEMKKGTTKKLHHSIWFIVFNTYVCAMHLIITHVFVINEKCFLNEIFFFNIIFEEENFIIYHTPYFIQKYCQVNTNTNVGVILNVIKNNVLIWILYEFYFPLNIMQYVYVYFLFCFIKHWTFLSLSHLIIL